MFRYVILCSLHFLSYFLFDVLTFSVVELDKGKIEIDGYNVRSIGFDVLRRGLALVPQDSTLFLGTLRDNL
jgi:ABC-type multidrug transport system fused ATPase/permease subunit